jgi:hypothetical protein
MSPKDIDLSEYTSALHETGFSNPDRSIVVGVDFGTDVTAFVVAERRAGGVVHIIDEGAVDSVATRAKIAKWYDDLNPKPRFVRIKRTYTKVLHKGRTWWRNGWS